MKLSEIYAILDSVAPKRISDEMCEKYGWYDNSGILVDTGEEITGIVFALDLSLGAIERATQSGANLIVTHHPAIYGKISRIDYYDEELLGKKLITCIRRGISVVAMHLNLDGAKGGIDESLMQGIAKAAGGEPHLLGAQMQMGEGAYGRAYKVERVSLGALVAGLKREFSTARIEVYGNGEQRVTKIASFCGSGADEKAIAFALAKGAEVIVSSDFKHHVLSLAIECGLQVITLTHYAAESYGFKKYYEKISRLVGVPCGYHAEENLL